MSGNTSGGLPYATGTDKVRDGDNAIQSLAEALDRRGMAQRVERRSVAVTPNAAGGFGISFARVFTTVPDLVCQCTSARSGFVPVIAQQAGSVTASGFSGIMANAMGGQAVTETVYVAYIAIGPDPNV
jgi:hypothetical protein